MEPLDPGATGDWPGVRTTDLITEMMCVASNFQSKCKFQLVMFDAS
jgi:hypothetical protein